MTKSNTDLIARVDALGCSSRRCVLGVPAAAREMECQCVASMDAESRAWVRRLVQAVKG